MTCVHGCVIGEQSGIVNKLIQEYAYSGNDDELMLEFFCACDCCDYLMHNSTCEGTDSGETLCNACQNK